MVDLFGRAGLLDKAKEVITGMSCKPTSAIWATLIGACKIHGNAVIGEWAAGKLWEMKPDHSGYYLLIANMYAAAGLTNKEAKVRTYMRDSGVKRTPGCAWVDVGRELCPFLAGDTSNPRSDEIHSLMDGLKEFMKDAGYVPSEGLVSSEEDFEELCMIGNELIEDAGCVPSEGVVSSEEDFEELSMIGNELIKDAGCVPSEGVVSSEEDIEELSMIGNVS